MNEVIKFLAMWFSISSTLIIKDILLIWVGNKRDKNQAQSPQATCFEPLDDNLKSISEHEENASVWAGKVQEELRNFGNAAMQLFQK